MKEKVFNASKMRELRKQNGLSQRQLASLSGLSLSAIQGYEQSRYEPKIDAINRISRALDVSSDLLYPEFETFVFNEEDPVALEVALLRNGGSPHLTNELGRQALARVLFEDLNEAGQRSAIDLLGILAKVPEYKKAEN